MGFPGGTISPSARDFPRLLGGLNLGPAEIQKAIATLDRKLRERAAGSASATLTSPINIGVGTK